MERARDHQESSETRRYDDEQAEAADEGDKGSVRGGETQV